MRLLVHLFSSWDPPRLEVGRDDGMDHSPQTRGRSWAHRRAAKEGLEVGAEIKLSRRRMPQADALTQDWGFLRGLQLEMVKVRMKNAPLGDCLL